MFSHGRKEGRKKNNPHLASSRRNGPTWLNFGDCLEVKVVYKLYGGCLVGVYWLSEVCLEGVWKVPGGCLEGVSRVSMGWPNFNLVILDWCS